MAGFLRSGHIYKPYLLYDITVPSRKRAHGWCTVHWAKIGGWADIRGISIAFKLLTLILIIVTPATIDISLIQAWLPIESEGGQL